MPPINSVTLAVTDAGWSAIKIGRYLDRHSKPSEGGGFNEKHLAVKPPSESPSRTSFSTIKSSGCFTDRFCAWLLKRDASVESAEKNKTKPWTQTRELFIGVINWPSCNRLGDNFSVRKQRLIASLLHSARRPFPCSQPCVGLSVICLLMKRCDYFCFLAIYPVWRRIEWVKPVIVKGLRVLQR